jgi:hypothetical protein
MIQDDRTKRQAHELRLGVETSSDQQDQWCTVINRHLAYLWKQITMTLQKDELERRD